MGEVKSPGTITEKTLVPLSLIAMLVSAVMYVATAFADSKNDRRRIEKLEATQEQQAKVLDDLRISNIMIQAKVGVDNDRNSKPRR
jgi:hypothetical protein